MFHRAFFPVIACCLFCIIVSFTHASKSQASDNNNSESEPPEIAPGWSCGPPVGVYDAPKGLELTGAENNYFYGSYQQLGSRGFFGDADVDRSSLGLFSNLNGWVGNPLVQAIGTGANPDIMTDLVTGSGASVSNLALNITPRYGNDWVKLKARYTINTYATSSAPGAAVPIALPQLTLWSVRVSTPICDIAVGKAIFQRGCSLQFSVNRTAEYIMLEKSYGVPNILGCLVGAGVLPPRAMSWFNPEFWPRYSRKYQKDTAKDLGDPEYQLYGGNLKTKQSIFEMMDESRQKEQQARVNKALEDANNALQEATQRVQKADEDLNRARAQRAEANEKLGEMNERVAELKNLKADAVLIQKANYRAAKWDNRLSRAIADESTAGLVLQEANREKYRAEEKLNMAQALQQEIDAEKEREKRWPSADDPYAWNYLTPGCLRIGLGFIGWEVPTLYPSGANSLTPYLVTPMADSFTTSPWNRNDFGLNAMSNLIAAITYTSSDLEFGVGCLRSTFHQGPEIQPVGIVNGKRVALSLSAPTFERYVTEGWAYLNYNNGRVFFKAEVDWFNRIFRFQRSQDGTFFGQDDRTDGSGSLFASKYWESWRYMAEAGAQFGPLAGRVFYSFLGGPDRRHGVYIDRQPFILELPQQALGLFDPYSSLLSFRFGSGVNAPGHIADASVFAIKLDYLLASNLMIEGSFLKAIRNSHGYAVGFIRPDTLNFGQVIYGEPPGSTPAIPAPSIPDRDLGWEAMVGVVWELLDKWTIKSQISYWQPGKWFNYACVDKGVSNWNIPSAANGWGIRPDRKIDPVLGLEINLGVSY